MNNRNELISVIVPVYNVEKYLSKCIESIINQKKVNIEIILVDDGSTDNSGAICDEYRELDKRINVIHKENGGLSSARNAGIDVAKGDFIIFIDSDDWVNEEMINTLLEVQKENEADITICDFIKTINENEVEQGENKFNKKVMTSAEALLALYDNKLETQMVLAWNKLYKKSLFNEIRFPNGKIHEDEFTTYKLFAISKKIVYIDKKLYYYRVNQDSIMNTKYSIKRLDVIDAFDERLTFAKRYDNKEFLIKTLQRFSNECIYAYLRCCKYLPNNKEEQLDIKKKSKKIITLYLKKSHIGIKAYLSYKLFLLNPKIYGLVKKGYIL